MLVLDTCALIFDALEPRRLSKAAGRAIEEADARGELAISGISLWETAMLVERGRLDPGASAEEFLRIAIAARGIAVIPISVAIAARAVALDLKGDPADRIIAATTLESGGRLVTSDRALRRARRIPTIW